MNRYLKVGGQAVKVPVKAVTSTALGAGSQFFDFKELACHAGVFGQAVKLYVFSVGVPRARLDALTRLRKRTGHAGIFGQAVKVSVKAVTSTGTLFSDVTKKAGHAGIFSHAVKVVVGVFNRPPARTFYNLSDVTKLAGHAGIFGGLACQSVDSTPPRPSRWTTLRDCVKLQVIPIFWPIYGHVARLGSLDRYVKRAGHTYILGGLAGMSHGRARY